MTNERKIALLVLCLIPAICFAIYANSLGGEFVWDDQHLIKNNVHIRSWSNIPRIFTSDWGAGSGEAYTFYRPLAILSHLFNYSFSGLNVTAYHLTNIILHILVSLVLYWFIVLLSGNRIISFFASLLFSAHPVHTEVVAYASGRVDSLAALFVLLAFAFYLRSIASGNHVFTGISALAFVLALCSKENSIILPGLLILYHFAFRRKIKISVYAPVIFVAVLYIFLRAFILKAVPLGVPPFASVIERLPGFFVAIPKYLRILVLPINLHMEYGDRLFSFADARVLFGAVLAAFLIIFAVARRKRDPLLCFSIGWFFIGLIPVSNLYPIAFYMAEHYLYLPSVGFFLLLGSLLFYLCRNKKVSILVIFFIGIVTLLNSYLTIAQNNYWKEPIAFYERTLAFAPGSWRVWHNLASVYAAEGEDEKALDSYRRAVISAPDNAMSLNDMALLYRKMGFHSKAIALAERARKLQPELAEPINTLALLYFDSGFIEESVRLYEKAMEVDPGHEESYINLGDLYHSIGKNGKAVQLYQKAIELNSFSEDAYQDLGAELITVGRHEEAIGTFENLLEINPENPDAHNNLAVLYFYGGMHERSVIHLMRAIELGVEVHPDFLKNFKRPDDN